MSEQKASYHTSNTRACFNCEGTMTRTDHPEPGWYCKVCDTFLPDDQAKPRPGPPLESVITQRLTFADGSEIVVTVKAPPSERPPATGGRLAADLATRHYYAYLLERLNLIEGMASSGHFVSKGPGD